MNKYIRTKDGIFELVDTYYKCVDGIETYMYNDKGRGVEINSDQILKKADTIEELCDEFRYEFDNVLQHEKCYEYANSGKWCDWDTDNELDEKQILTVKGGIWTDKGLIYKAKMNENGGIEKWD